MASGATTPSEMHDGAVEAGAAGARVEKLLDELARSAGPQVWPRVEELMRALMELYGRGLGRLFEHLAAAGVLDDGLGQRLADDELVASLLGLHGLHPLPAETRIRRALDEVAPQLGRIELIALDDGVARLRAVDAPPLDGAGETLERVVLEAAPELVRVEIDGLRQARRGPLVQIDLSHSRARAGR